MHSALFAHDFYERIVILWGIGTRLTRELQWSWETKPVLKVDILKIQGFHLIATVSMAPPVSLTVIIITGAMSPECHGSDSYSPDVLSQLCVVPLSIWLYSYLTGSVKGEGEQGVIIQTATPVSGVHAKCMFPRICTHFCSLCVCVCAVFPFNILAMFKISPREWRTRPRYTCQSCLCFCVHVA